MNERGVVIPNWFRNLRYNGLVNDFVCVVRDPEINSG